MSVSRQKETEPSQYMSLFAHIFCFIDKTSVVRLIDCRRMDLAGERDDDGGGIIRVCARANDR